MTFRTPPSLRQQGNTLVGIVIGLVIGLVIAVVVALMITKGQSPFTDRAPKAGKTDQADGQISDPNKPMYGNKEAARKANNEFEKENKAPPADELQRVVDNIQAQGEAKPAAPKPAPTPAPAADKPAMPAPVNSAAPPTQAAAPAPSTTEDKYIYYLQAGAFREISDAEATRAKLALLGFEASVSDRTNDNVVLHRVRMGPFSQVEAMNKVRSKLSENGIDAAVVRTQK